MNRMSDVLAEPTAEPAGLLPQGIALIIGGPVEIAALSARLAAVGLPSVSPVGLGMAMIRLEGATEPPRLTRREQEIAGLLIEGLPNPRIALRLTISQATVRTHVRHILRKLGLANRAQVAARLSARTLATEQPDGLSRSSFS